MYLFLLLDRHANNVKTSYSNCILIGFLNSYKSLCACRLWKLCLLVGFLMSNELRTELKHELLSQYEGKEVEKDGLEGGTWEV